MQSLHVIERHSTNNVSMEWGGGGTYMFVTMFMYVDETMTECPLRGVVCLWKMPV